MSLNNDFVLLIRPSILTDLRVKVVVPPLPALLANPSRQLFGNVAPVFGTTLLDQL